MFSCFSSPARLLSHTSFLRYCSPTALWYPSLLLFVKRPRCRNRKLLRPRRVRASSSRRSTGPSSHCPRWVLIACKPASTWRGDILLTVHAVLRRTMRTRHWATTRRVPRRQSRPASCSTGRSTAGLTTATVEITSTGERARDSGIARVRQLTACKRGANDEQQNETLDIQ